MLSPFLAAHTSPVLAEPDAPPVVTVAYVSEVPFANAETGNPLEVWARSISAHLASVSGERPREGVKNLMPILTWKKLERLAYSPLGEHLFVIQGYEFVEQQHIPLQSLLVPSVKGKAAKTEFVILRQRKAAGVAPRFRMQDLKGREVLVDRGGCGELVYRWLDCEVRMETGDGKRDELADFRTAPSAAEAILSVYFEEVVACVVSRAAYDEVMRSNPAGVKEKLEEVRSSPALLETVIACPKTMTPKRRAELQQNTTGIRLHQAGTFYGLTVPAESDFATLVELRALWEKLYKGEKPAPPGGNALGSVSPPVKGGLRE